MTDGEQIELLPGGPAPTRGPLLVPRGYTRGVCRSCRDTATFWVTLVDADGNVRHNAKTGKPSRMLVNLGHVHNGNVILRQAGRAWVIKGPLSIADHESQRFEPHFATCPHADAHRRR